MILTLEGLQVIALLCQPSMAAKSVDLKCQKYYVQCVKDVTPTTWHSSSIGEALQECLLNKKDE